jgi:hypothetical protein
MSFLQALKEGLHVVNRNWQLVFIHLIFMIISFISFFFIVGIPVAIAFIVFGLDLTELLRLKDVVAAFRDSAEALGRYFGIAVLVVLSFLVYALFAAMLWVFTIAGTVGLLVRSMINEEKRFGLAVFFSEGKRLFFRVLLFSGVIAFIFVCLAIVLGGLGGVASVVIETAKSHEATLALFLGVFFSLVLISAGIALILVTLSVTVYGIACLGLTGSSPLKAVNRALRYLYDTPSAVGFYGLLLLGYMAIGALVLLIGSPLTLIPLIGSILSLPLQIISYFIQAYASLIMLSAAFGYYFRTGYEAPVSASTQDSDTSPPQDEAPSQAPEEKGENPRETP